jgi:hypothetical protein
MILNILISSVSKGEKPLPRRLRNVPHAMMYIARAFFLVDFHNSLLIRFGSITRMRYSKRGGVEVLPLEFPGFDLILILRLRFADFFVFLPS